MPNIDFSNVEESTGDTFEHIAPGGYIFVVRSVEHVSDKQYIRILWDVAEGEYKGFYAKSQYPPADIASYKEKALGLLKHKLSVLSDANPGFDAEKAFQADDWKAFAGKIFGGVIRKRLYTKSDGTDGEGIEIGRWCKISEIRAGDYRELNPRDTRDPETKKPQQPVPAPVSFTPQEVNEYSTVDVPF